MDNLFNDPGDLGFFDYKEEVVKPDELDNNLFDERLPGSDSEDVCGLDDVW